MIFILRAFLDMRRPMGADCLNGSKEVPICAASAWAALCRNNPR